MAVMMTGDREVFNQVVFGSPDHGLLDYINQTNQYYSNYMTDVGRQLVQDSQQLFARTATTEAMILAKAAIRAANVYLQHDAIRNILTIDELQSAPTSMVRWVMAHPELRKLHNANRIDAYGERYIDMQPDGSYGWKHDDYCTVYSGWMNTVTEEIVTQDENGEDVIEVVGYDEWEEVLEDEEEEQLLDDVEAALIIAAHGVVDYALSEGRDPTSYYDSDI